MSPLPVDEYLIPAPPEAILSRGRWFPIIDEQVHEAIGFCHEVTTGVYVYYDLEGNWTGMDEKPLEDAISPFEVLSFAKLGFTATRGMVRGFGGLLVAKKAAGSFSNLCLPPMRTAWARLAHSGLELGKAAAEHAASDRYVPLTVLRQAVKVGKRVVDPVARSPSVGELPFSDVSFYAQMFKWNVRSNGLKEYTLKVVVRFKGSGVGRGPYIRHYHYYEGPPGAR